MVAALLLLIVAGAALPTRSAGAATGRPIHCVIAFDAMSYASWQFTHTPAGELQDYWGTRILYWVGYMDGAGC